MSIKSIVKKASVSTPAAAQTAKKGTTGISVSRTVVKGTAAVKSMNTQRSGVAASTPPGSKKVGSTPTANQTAKTEKVKKGERLSTAGYVEVLGKLVTAERSPISQNKAFASKHKIDMSKAKCLAYLRASDSGEWDELGIIPHDSHITGSEEAKAFITTHAKKLAKAKYVAFFNIVDR